jgi:hypothetical protein
LASAARSSLVAARRVVARSSASWRATSCAKAERSPYVKIVPRHRPWVTPIRLATPANVNGGIEGKHLAGVVSAPRNVRRDLP